MHVLIVTQYFWPESFRVNDLAAGLRERNHDVTVLTGFPNYPNGRYEGYGRFSPRREVYRGVQVLRVPIVSRNGERGWRLVLNYLSYMLSASILGPLICREEYDAVLAFQPSPVLVGVPAVTLSRLRSAPLFFWVQDLWPESLSAAGATRSRSILRIVASVVKWIYRNSRLVLIQSRAFRSKVVESGGSPEKIRYLPNWAEEVYRPLAHPAPSEKEELPNGFCVLYAGNIGVSQSFETVLDAFEALRAPGVQLVLLGDGNRRRWLQEQVEKRNLSNVTWLGRRPVESMPRFFAAADALLVSLRKDPIFALTIPSKVQSYLACGKPIVAALEGEGRRVVEEARAGVVCAPEDPGSLARAILELVALPEHERREMGERGRAYYEENFDRTRLIGRVEEWLLEAAEHP